MHMYVCRVMCEFWWKGVKHDTTHFQFSSCESIIFFHHSHDVLCYILKLSLDCIELSFVLSQNARVQGSFSL